VKIIFICTKSITFNTFLYQQAKYFIKKGLKVEVACSDIKYLNFKNKLKHKIDFPNRIIDLFNLIRYIKIFIQINKLVKKNISTIFYLHTPVASHLFRLFTFFYKLKIIYFVHGFRFTPQTHFIKNIFFKIIERILSLQTGIFITINNCDYNYAKLNFIKRALCYKINGIGLNLPSDNLIKKIKKKKKIKKILVIAAYKKEKGYLDILKVAEILRYKKIQINCYGYGSFKNFEALKIKKGIHNISFKKFDVNLSKKIKNFDILLHLSKREGLPVAVMESLSQGLPVICYNIRGNNDLIKDKFNGYFVSSYKDALRKILYLNLEEDVLNKMRLNAFRSIDKSFTKKIINLNIFRIINNYFKDYK
jgi:glycosyltransferase involved in cell wall biosynthesis